MIARRTYMLCATIAILAVVSVLGMLTTALPGGAGAQVAAAPSGQDEPVASNCLVDLSKWVDPSSIVLGDSAGVTLVVSGTCPAKPLPIDLVILADESTSMTRGRPGGPLEPPPTIPSEPVTPNPETPPTPRTPPPGRETPDGREGEPPFCNPGGMHEMTPSPTPTRWHWRTPTPAPPDRPKPTPIGEYAGDTDQIREVQSWVSDFVKRPEIQRDFASGRLRVGFASFSNRARIRQSLTEDPGRVESAARKMRGANITRINMAVREAERILLGSGARLDEGDEARIKVVIILSDFEFCRADMKRFDSDVHVFSAGFAVRNYDRSKMYDLASRREYVAERHVIRDTISRYEPLAVGGKPVFMEQLTVRDELDDRMTLMPGSVDPPTVTITGQLLEWQFASPTLPMTLGYAVEPMAAGLISVSKQAGVLWVDTEAGAGAADFPDVQIEVIAYTPTPTPTSTYTPTPTPTYTPTPTPTPTPADLYLPITYKVWPEPIPTPTICVPEDQIVDVALVIDTSTSMSEATQAEGKAKLTAAIEAAEELVALLKAEDQTAVVGFNSDATVITTLTTDKALVVAGLRSLPGTQAEGTSIDKGLREGLAELMSSRRQAGSHRVIVLVTDGKQTGPGGDDAVREAAQAIDDEGITLITIGLGSDVDDELLRSIATRPEYFFKAPNAEDLVEVYRQIARTIPCP